MSLPIWDSTLSNSVKPPSNLFENGWSQTDVIASEHLNYLFNLITNSLMQTGAIVSYTGVVGTSTFPAGFLPCQGGTVGAPDSNGTYRSDQYFDLFVHLWGSIAAANLPVAPGGRGASAQADWTANKTITMPNLSGAIPVQIDPSIPEFVAAHAGQIKGTEEETISVAQMPSHSHSSSPYLDNSLPELASGGNINAEVIYTPFRDIASGDVGGGKPHNNVSLTYCLYYLIKV